MTEKLRLQCDEKLTNMIHSFTAFHSDKDHLECLRDAVILYDMVLRNEYRGGSMELTDSDGDIKTVSVF